MNGVANPGHQGKFLHPHLVYTLFKYTIYVLIGVDVVVFFQEDLAASAATFGSSIEWSHLVEAFTASIDTAAWLVLLLLFELETAVISDDKLEGSLKWFLMGIRVVCYFFIVSAFFGYINKYGVIIDVSPFSIADVCSLAGGDWNWVADFDDYPTLDAETCLVLQGETRLRVNGTQIIGSVTALAAARDLAIVDIVNAGTWLIIVVLLEAEVWLQLRELLTERTMKAGKIIKGFFYSLLFVCVVLWWMWGDFIDYWDAFLWLVAFIFIEMNIFKWHEETEELHEFEVETQNQAITR